MKKVEDYLLLETIASFVPKYQTKRCKGCKYIRPLISDADNHNLTRS